jgi:hypothetical protein
LESALESAPGLASEPALVWVSEWGQALASVLPLDLAWQSVSALESASGLESIPALVWVSEWPLE